MPPSLPSSESDLNIHSLGSKFDIEILEEASYILWYIWRTLYPRYSTLQTCIDALSNDAKLYKALKHAHKQRAYDVVRNWGKLFSVTAALNSPHKILDRLPGLSIHKDSIVLSEINEFLNQLQPAMMKLVLGEICLPLWSPQPGVMSDATSEHISKLRIPFLKGKPNVLLHDLGSFKDDPTLAARINNIFMPNNHTQVTSQVHQGH